MKRKKDNRKYKIFSHIFLVISLIFFYLIYYINVLPIKYLVPILIILSLLNLSLWFLLACPKIKNNIKKKSLIFSVILLIIYIFISFFIVRTMGFLDSIKSEDSKITNYLIYVRDDSNYLSLEDLTNKKIGYYKANEDANKNISIQIDFKQYSNISSMFKDLIDKKTSSLIIEESLRNMFYEENPNSFNDLKILYKFSITENTNSVAKKVDVSKKSFNIYLSGIDTYGDINSVSRSDVNIVATINPITKNILLTSIPRDYYVELYGKNGNKDKLTHAGIYGVEESIKTIEQLLKIDINYYVKVNFTSLIDVVNALDGINVKSDYTFTSIDGYNYKKGNNYLYGEKALSFARERKAFENGDRQRGKNQEAIIEAILNKVVNPSIITKYDTLLAKLSSKVQMNLSQKEIMNLIKMQIDDGAMWSINSNSLDGTNSLNYTYSYPDTKLYVMEPIHESIEKAKELIKQVKENEI